MSANKRVSFIQSLLADPEKKKKLMVDSIIATQAREGIKTTREQAEAAYAKVQSEKKITPEPIRRPARAEADVPVVAAVPAKTPAGTQTPADSRTLERIQQVTGVLRAYDGRYCVWGANGSFDVRDIGNRVGLSMHDVVDALPDFTPVKRGRASVTPDEDSTE